MKPPKDIEPDVLFRILTTRPVPFRKIEHKIYLLDRFELFAKALTSSEIQRARDEGGVQQIAALSIYCDGERAFETGEEVGSLEFSECSALLDAWGNAFSVICPAMLAPHAALWQEVIYKGAQSFSNFSVVLAMSECCDVAVGSTVVRTPRPDRYYGVPVADLTDGQRMAFSAANKFVNEQIESANKE